MYFQSESYLNRKYFKKPLWTDTNERVKSRKENKKPIARTEKQQRNEHKTTRKRKFKNEKHGPNQNTRSWSQVPERIIRQEVVKWKRCVMIALSMEYKSSLELSWFRAVYLIYHVNIRRSANDLLIHCDHNRNLLFSWCVDTATNSSEQFDNKYSLKV